MTGAASSNILVAVAYPAVALILLWAVIRRWRGDASPAPAPARFGYALRAVPTVFMIYRNTPAGRWLAPI